MDLINPFEDVSKAAPVAWPPPGAVTLTALVPTGRHVSHANDLKVVRNPRGGGGRANKLEHYGRRRVSKGSAAEGLRMAAGAKGVMPLRSPSGTKPAGALESALRRRRNPALNSNVPSSGQSGRRIGA